LYDAGVNFPLVLLAASALSQARAHLAAGKLDAVLIDLHETQGDPGEEARVLTQAAERAKARAGVHFGGVPVLDVNGTLMEGFSSSAIDDALLH
jgi:hypothetical protein